MGRFVGCGNLSQTNGRGFKPSEIITAFNSMKNNIYKGNFRSFHDSEFIIDGKFNFPVEIEEITGSFNCILCNLISLEGAPKKVEFDFYCNGNNLTSLKGAPKYVGGDFDCSSNYLKSLAGAPEFVGRNFNCYNNKLTSLEGCPKEVDGLFNIQDNPRKFTEEEVRAVCRVKGEVYV